MEEIKQALTLVVSAEEYQKIDDYEAWEEGLTPTNWRKFLNEDSTPIMYSKIIFQRRGSKQDVKIKDIKKITPYVMVDEKGKPYKYEYNGVTYEDAYVEFTF